MEEADALNVEQLYMKLTFGKDEYIDKVTLSSSEFYKKLESSEAIPTTTLINSSEFTELYEKYPDDDLILITISSKLSGTYHSACVAKEADVYKRQTFPWSRQSAFGFWMTLEFAFCLLKSITPP